ncbi:S1C family serine protease [Blastococcus mobilis]|uniref:Serine protease, S1-C subfamily, contains C-terminal PDZ domain n=1 Tax=Blastococcus mobilis TaxID=1938746 RepID=A0A238V718_9ACTN|nr:trypsin-like peptidase domain-containing protein [Blastococcus mobilis]SNR29847.1 serine protease, S1-C subfamily, contains C-terminal PDZ domain [Blastococcus mobilis]
MAGRGRGRRRLWFVVVAALASGACTHSDDAPEGAAATPALPSAPSAQADTLAVVPDVAARLQPSVVTVLTAIGSGSGVVYSDEGLIVTNEHVVRGASAVDIAFADGQRVPGRVLAVDVVTDLALVESERTGLPPADFQSELPEIGELAIVIGSPLGFQSTVTAGVISGLHRDIPGSAAQSASLVDLIQTDAAISPGNSGGAVVDGDGDVIGISEAYIPPQAGAVSLGFAIPAATVIDVVEQLQEDGTADHAFLGIEPAPITPQIAEQLDLPSTDGVIVSAVVSGGPAASAGVRPGDVITAVDGEPTESPEALLAALRERDPGETVTLSVRGGGGREQDLDVVLTERPSVSE